MRTAILADIHGNLEALGAVLADLEGWQADRVVCLGDTIGYGPNPRECLREVAALSDVLIIGNHEASGLSERTGDLGADMGEVLDWSVAQVADLEVWQHWREQARSRGLEALAEARDGDLSFVHGAPGAPVTTYVWPGHSGQYLKENRLLDDRLAGFLQALPTPLTFCGHTHIPAVLAPYAFHPRLAPVTHWNVKRTFVGPRCVFLVPHGSCQLDLSNPGGEPWRILINPGSVGQPRDGNLRACYAVLDGDSLHLIRVPYDVETTREKVRALPVGEAAKQGLLLRLGVLPPE